MPKKKSQADEPEYFNARKFPAANSEEAKENQMISLAMDLVEYRLRNGTATSQETTHFLKLGSVRARQEQQRAEMEMKLLDAKTNTLLNADKTDEGYERVIRSMREYSGEYTDDEE